ncbi:MAG: Na/Pi cotransporter family protein [Firmicutes bacterium]|nr:Na/Pi cotransporter family protein [Bacillota bacterium]
MVNLFLPVIGGLGLFLYGMNMMGSALERAAGSKMKKMVEALTSNRFKGVLVGMLVTMFIQSSSATTVMVGGFVNAGIMNLGQAVGVIMGANIGTTVTSQLIAFRLTDYAPLAIGLGVAVWIIIKNQKIKTYAEVLIGFGILFVGMDMMGTGLKPMSELPAFTRIITSLNNPFLGMLVGLLLTTVVQSSSASVGLLQALAGQGLIDMNLAFPILYGENIGTTTTALLSSIGANRVAKRAAFIHFFMKLIGTLLFMTVFKMPIEKLVLAISPDNAVWQIANAHSIFNVLNTIILFPFISQIVRVAEFVIPADEDKKISISKYLDKRILSTPTIALNQAHKEVERMGQMVLGNLIDSKEYLIKGKSQLEDDIFAMEESVNKIHKEIIEYLILLSNSSLNEEDNKTLNHMLLVIGDIERVGDHVENISELAQEKQEKSLDFSALADQDLIYMYETCENAFKIAMEAYQDNNNQFAREVVLLEDLVDKIEMENKRKHIARLNKGECNIESGIIFLDIISNLERIADHSSNISLYVLDQA